MAEVREPNFRGIDLTHPRIQEAMKDAAKRGISKEEIVKRIGVPWEYADNAVQKLKKRKNNV